MKLYHTCKRITIAIDEEPAWHKNSLIFYFHKKQTNKQIQEFLSLQFFRYHASIQHLNWACRSILPHTWALIAYEFFLSTLFNEITRCCLNSLSLNRMVWCVHWMNSREEIQLQDSVINAIICKQYNVRDGFTIVFVSITHLWFFFSFFQNSIEERSQNCCYLH